MRTILALILLLLAAQGVAQDRYFTLWGGPAVGSVNLSSFDDFAATFNTANQSELESELGGFGISFGGQLGATYMLTPGIGISFSYQQHRSSTSASFTDGSSRHFQHDLYTPLNGGFLFRIKRIDIQPRMGFCQANLRSWTEYADGTLSYGNERLLNGVFRTFGLFAGIDVGTHIKLSDTVQLGVGAAWCGVSGSQYNETNTARSVDTAPFYPSYIPTDWELWLDLNAANELTSYATEDYVTLKGSWYYAFVNLMVDLK